MFQPRSRRATERLPVTLVTGFLGSGKTTLVNHILSNRHGVRAAVLVNELGEIGIDNELIIARDEDMIELNNPRQSRSASAPGRLSCRATHFVGCGMSWRGVKSVAPAIH